MKDCIFCNIISGDIPCSKLYEDEHTFAFLDIAPNNPGHALVIPKEHFENIYTLPKEVLGHISHTVKKVAVAVKKGVDADGINIAMNNDAEAGQIVFHAHIHVIPRFKNDGYTHWPKIEYKEGEMEAVQKKIKDSI